MQIMVSLDVTPPPPTDDVTVLSRSRQNSPTPQAHRKHILPQDKVPVEMDIDDVFRPRGEVFDENEALVKKRETTITAPTKAASINQNKTRGVLGRFTVGFYFLIWYALNVVYNSESK